MMSEEDDLRALASKLSAPAYRFAPATYIKGVVVSVQTGPPPTVTVTLSGDSTEIPGVRFMRSYRPVAGDTVMILKQGDARTIIDSYAEVYPVPQTFGALTTTTLTASGAVSAASVTASGAVQAGALTSLGNVNGVNITASATVQGADLVATDDLTVGDDADVVGTLTAGNIASDTTVTGTNITGSGTVQGSTVTSTGAMNASSLAVTNVITANDITASDQLTGNIVTASTSFTLNGEFNIRSGDMVSGTRSGNHEFIDARLNGTAGSPVARDIRQPVVHRVEVLSGGVSITSGGLEFAQFTFTPRSNCEPTMLLSMFWGCAEGASGMVFEPTTAIIKYQILNDSTNTVLHTSGENWYSTPAGNDSWNRVSEVMMPLNEIIPVAASAGTTYRVEFLARSITTLLPIFWNMRGLVMETTRVV